MENLYVDSTLFQYVLLPLLITAARVLDVSMATIRILLLGRGVRNIAAIIGFFEVLIWLFALTQLLNNISNGFQFVAFALGFALGNWTGSWLEEKIALGNVAVRVITQKNGLPLIKALRKQNFRITHIDAHGLQGAVHIIFAIVKRKSLKQVQKTIKQFNPLAFYSVEDVRSVNLSDLPFTKEISAPLIK
ncbi:MAG: DUF2179 domain-containing protein [bacterium]|nr:DUF2179 domain-containing protein [bacterium]